MKELTVGLLADGLYTWDGGTDFLTNIASVLQQANVSGERKIKIYLILPREYLLVRLLRRVFKRLDRHENANINRLINAFDNLNFQIPVVYYRKHVRKLYDDHGRSLDKTLRNIKADICLPVLRDYYPEITTPWMGYIADFQEKYLPYLFDAKTIAYREKNSVLQAQNTSYFLLTSESVKDDLTKFYPGKYTAFAQPFAPVAAEEFVNCAIDISQYNLPDRYFIISNQFWAHKNHITAIKAIRILRDRGYEDVGLVCTGRMNSDERDPSYCRKLINIINELDLEKQVQFVGFIPKMDQIQMIKNSVALIQPSLFEGDPGGCSVYNAYSLMVPSVISDIKVNAEAEESELIRHYSVLDEKDLADKLEELLVEKRNHPEKEQIRKQNEKNARTLLDYYLSAIEECISGYRPFKV